MVLVRECTLVDVAALEKISRQTFSKSFADQNSPDDLKNYLAQSFNPDQLTLELSDSNSAFYFIYVADQLAGYLKVNFDNAQTEKMGAQTLEVQRIYILSAFKHQGLGTHLIHKASELAGQLHKHRIWLGVWEHNQPARRFYEHLGFQVISDHIFTLGQSRQRDLIMARGLI